MALDFSASFAACLAAQAAGLKVPQVSRQIMYCITQDSPYVLYKDGMERGQPTPNQWGPTGGGPTGPSDVYAPQTSQPQASSASGSPQQLCVEPDQPAAVQSAMTSPVASPYPPPPPPEVQQQQQQQQQQQHGVAVDEDAAPQQPPPPPPQHEQQLSPTHPSQHNDVESQRPAPPQCYPSQEMQQQQQQQQYPQHYSPRNHHMPPIMSPTSFMHYLKQPGVMLTPLGHMGTEAVMADNFGNGNMPDMRAAAAAAAAGALPDIIQQQHQQQAGSGKGKHTSDLRLFKCLTCGKDFKQKSTLLQHERIHTDSRPYGCTECGKRFRQQSHLTQHLRIHANEKPFACVYCERTFRQRAILNQHLRIHSGEKPFECPECGKRFRQKAILNQHIRTHQDVSPHLVYKNGTLWPQDVPFPPDMDSKDNVTENGGSPFDGDQNSQANDHRQSNGGCFSPESNVQYPAYFKDAKGMNHAVFGPGSNFALQYLKQGKGLPDVIQHGRSAGMPLYVRCPICQKEFKQKSTLLQHGCIHIESRPYPCPECGKRFRQQSHLTQHLRIHTNEKPYGCGFCGRNFRQRTILNQHLRIHTGEKPYKCTQCGKDFRQKAILDQHTRTHQGERPYCCPMPNCRRRFATEPEVKKHIDNHMNPHANKGRRPSPGTDAKHLLGRGMPPMAVVKPEFYISQCYVPAAFGHQAGVFSNAGQPGGETDFKPLPPHPFAQNTNQSHGPIPNGDFKPIQTAAVSIVAHQFPPPNGANPNSVQAPPSGEFPKPTPVQ